MEPAPRPSTRPSTAAVVDVWVRRVADVTSGRELLDDHELGTLSAITAPITAMSYAAGHVLARRAVASVVGSPAAEVRFERTCDTCELDHGKPVLPDYPMLHVSLSHSNEHVAVAVTSAGPVGVDAESVRGTDFAGYADVALHPDDRARVEEPLAGRLARRATAWVRKEAALKALGIGLREDPATVRVPPSGSAVRLVADRERVTVVDVSVPWPDAAAAVAVVGTFADLAVRLR